jgi:lysophospholipase L1-like esterase
MKKENKKIPFNVFSEKNLKIFAMTGVVIASPFILAGCSDGKDGSNGEDGTKFLAGLSYTEFTDAKVGDFFIDTDDYILYTKTTNDWEVVIRNFGKPGANGQDGVDGKDGQTVTVSINSKGYWVINGTVTNTKATGKDGNTPYINSDGYWYIGNTSTGVKAQGEQGLQGNVGKSAFELYKEENPEFNGTLQDWLESLKGQNGENGQDGTSVYIGYDEYVWNGETKTKYKLQLDETNKTNVFEDTIEVSNAMKKYFDYEYVDLSSNTIALMQYYKPNAQMTIYGNTTITELQVVSEDAGTLYIGKANVSDIVNSRTKGTKLKASTKSYSVNEGVNTIKFDTPLELAEGETLVLGGSGSTAKLYVAKNIPEDDEVGNFTLINGKTNTSIISKTGKYADTLAIMVKAKAVSEGEAPVFENFTTKYTSNNVSSGVYIDYTPFKYNSSYDSNFSGKTITKIGAYMDANNASSGENPYMTIYKIKTSTTKNFAENAIETIKVYFPANSTVGSLVYADCNIALDDDETIAFGKSDDTFIWRFKPASGDGNLLNNDGTEGPSATLAFDIYVEKTVECDFDTHLSNLNEKESTKALKNALTGKNLSILGDSISTFDGYSNDSTNTNSTIGSNYVSYGTSGSGRDLALSSVNDTWWMQTANMTGMNVLVNNSYGGSKVTDTSSTSANALTRAQNLHDNTGKNANTNPDIIAVYMGINDFINGVSSTDFATAYDKMISQIRTTYGNNVKIFVFTHVTYGSVGDNNSTLLAYNTAIKETADKYNCVVVDYANSGVKSSNLSTYMQDSSRLHPNEKGMDIISDCFWDALYKTYVTKSSN